MQRISAAYDEERHAGGVLHLYAWARRHRSKESFPVQSDGLMAHRRSREHRLCSPSAPVGEREVQTEYLYV